MNGQNKLRLIFWIPIVICGLMVVCYECGLLMEGSCADDKQMEYYCVLVMELLTLVLIPLSLRLFRLPCVVRSIRANPSKRLAPWRYARMAMLSVPMMVNVALYYQFVLPSFGYMAIIGMLSQFFVYPSAARCQAEENME